MLLAQAVSPSTLRTAREYGFHGCFSFLAIECVLSFLITHEAAAGVRSPPVDIRNVRLALVAVSHVADFDQRESAVGANELCLWFVHICALSSVLDRLVEGRVGCRMGRVAQTVV